MFVSKIDYVVFRLAVLEFAMEGPPPPPPPPPVVVPPVENRREVGLAYKIKERMQSLRKYSLNCLRFNPKSAKWEIPKVNKLRI